MDKIIGKVLWFDRLSGIGVVASNNGDRYTVHYSAIQGEGCRKPHMHRSEATAKKPYIERNLYEGEPVEFTIYDNGHIARVAMVWRLS